MHSSFRYTNPFFHSMHSFFISMHSFFRSNNPFFRSTNPFVRSMHSFLHFPLYSFYCHPFSFISALFVRFCPIIFWHCSSALSILTHFCLLFHSSSFILLYSFFSPHTLSFIHSNHSITHSLFVNQIFIDGFAGSSELEAAQIDAWCEHIADVKKSYGDSKTGKTGDEANEAKVRPRAAML
jgi:hypothetical protein